MSRWESQEYQDTHTSERKMQASSVQHVPKTALTKPALISLICLSSNKIFQCFKKWSDTALTVCLGKCIKKWRSFFWKSYLQF